MKLPAAVSALFIAVAFATARELPPSMDGSSSTRLSDGSSALRQKTISSSFHSTETNKGLDIGNVNAFTGSSTYGIPLGAIGARGKLNFPMSIGYSGKTREVVRASNDVSPAGMVGLGWNFSHPSVSRNTMGTYYHHDDVFYADLGVYGGGQLLVNGSGKYFIASNPYVDITFELGSSGSLAGQIVRWIFKFPDGVKYLIGESTAEPGVSHRTTPYVPYNITAIVQASPYTIADSRPYVYKWDLKEIQDAENANRLLFDYQKNHINVFQSASKGYTRESYLKSVRLLDKYGGEAAKWQFTYGDKSGEEYHLPTPDNPPTNPEPVETKYLQKIEIVESGILSQVFNFHYRTVGPTNQRKRLLDSMAVSSRFSESSGALVRTKPWKFAYEDASRFYMLKSVVHPNRARSEFTYGNAPLGAHAQQNTTTYTLQGPSGNALAFPDSWDWKNQSSCDERFCYLMASRRSESLGDSLYLNIVPHSGNYFDDAGRFRKAWSFTYGYATGPIKPEVIPYGDYFLAFDPADNDVHMNQWDGIKWNAVGLPAFPTLEERAHLMDVHPSKNYFLVESFVAPEWFEQPTLVTPVIKTGSTWTALNQANCDVGSSGDWGEEYRTGSGCMRFDGGDVMIRTSEKYFLVVHQPTGIIFFNAFNAEGTGFSNFNDRFLPFGDGVQRAGYPNNWEFTIEDVQVSGDYFIVRSSGNYNAQRLDVMHFDGSNIRRVATSGWQEVQDQDIEVFVQGDYFISANRFSGELLMWRKSNLGNAIGFNTSFVRGDVPDREYALSVKTSPEAFAVEYGFFSDANTRTGLEPMDDGSGDIASYLYRVDFNRSSGFEDVTPSLVYTHPTYGASKLGDLSFSSSESFLVGTLFRIWGDPDSRCFGYGCDKFYVSMRMRPRPAAGYGFLHSGKPIPEFAATYSQDQKSFHQGGRLAALSLFDYGDNRMKYRLYQWDGNDFEGSPDSVYVVTQYAERSGLDSTRLDAQYAFTYNSSLAEYNIHEHAPMFQEVTLARVDRSGADQGKTRINFNLDYVGKRLLGKDLQLNGSVASKTVTNKAGQTLSLTTHYYTPPSNLVYPSDWPSQIAINRMDSIEVTTQRPNGSRQKISTRFSQYSNINGAARFTKQKQGDRWLVTETLRNSLGLPVQTITYDFPVSAYPVSGPPVETWTSASPFDAIRAIASSRAGYSTTQPYLVEKGYLWRDVHEGLTDADLKAGKEPVFDVNQNWVQTTQVTQRNAFTQVREVKAIRDTTAAGENYSSTFYEGKRSLPVASVSNSRLDNCAVLMAEDGDMNNALDQQGRWTNHGTTFSGTLARSGRYGLKVVDNFGPMTDMYLKNVRQDGFGYVVSAWIYRPTGSTVGGLYVERYNAAGTRLDAFSGTLVPQFAGEPPANNRWQLWEVKLTHAQLTAGNLFQPGANDRLRAFVGPGHPSGNPAQVLYVDDIVCRPDNAGFSLTTYDYRGLPSSTTDNWHLSGQVDRDYAGGVAGTRDERHRILSQGAQHLPGENPATKHGRAYAFGFENGTLLPNWSFEGIGSVWDSTAFDNVPGFSVSPRLPGTSICAGCKAVTGSFVGRVSGANSASSRQGRMYSTLIPILPSQAYTFSMYLRSSGVAGTTTAWAVRFYSDKGATEIGSSVGPAYGSLLAWTLYRHGFTTPANAAYAKVVMAQSSTAGHGGTFYFDDLLLEEGTLDNAAVLARRARVMESVAFSDASGRGHQSQIRIATNADQSHKYILSGTLLDNFGRPDTSILPVTVNLSHADYQPYLVAKAKAYWTAVGGRPEAGGFPFSTVRYFEEPNGRARETGSPGAAWRIGASPSRTPKGDFYFVDNLSLPPNIEAPAAGSTASTYLFTWSKDVEGNYSLSWTDIKGRLVQSMTNENRAGTTGPAGWKWLTTRFEYYRSGLTRRVLTPLDVAAGTSRFAEVKNYNSAGQVIASWAPGRGLSKAWYGRSGRVRFTQDSGQAIAGIWAYQDYDARGRLIARGTQGGFTPRQTLADLNSYAGGTKSEKTGYIYDHSSTFQARTGLALSGVMPEASSINERFSKDRLWCSYNRNADSPMPGYAAADKFVADFAGFNQRGERVVSLKAIGPIRDANKKRQKATYSYDVAGRLVNAKVQKSASETALSNEQTIGYDNLGRMQRVLGLGGKPLAYFVYNDWGSLRYVTLGGDGSGNVGARVEYAYHIQGWVKEIKATQLGTGKIVFQQFLGYEGKANGASQVPNPIKARYDGQITQQLYKFASDVNSLKPVRLVNYNYDELGRMVGADYQQNSNATPLNADESINFGALTWSNTGSGDSYYAYDANGRITGQRTGGVAAGDSARYVYQDGNYKLDRVIGKLSPTNTRAMGTAGTFVYNNRGALVEDKSKKLTLAHGWDLMPVKLTKDNGSGTLTTQYQFYDASGNRVSRVETVKPSGGVEARTHSRSYAVIGGRTHKEWHETYNSTGGIASTAEVVNLFAGGQVGKIRKSGKYEFYVKNHLGSTMRTVDDLGGYATDGNVLDYMAYGDPKKLKVATEEATEKYTGKEYEDLYRLYHFGARFYDPELAVWLSPDPANQYSNPYFYVGGDPIMRLDPNGMWSLRRSLRKATQVVSSAASGVASVASGVTSAASDAASVAGRMTVNATVDAGNFVVEHKGEIAMATLIVAGVAMGGAPVLIAAGIGAATGVGTQLAAGNTDLESLTRGALIGGVVGAAGGAGALAMGGLSAAATGAVGLAANSGLAAAVAGGAVTGLGAGAAAGLAGYSAGVLAANDFNSMEGWNLGDAAKATVAGGVAGAASGAVMSAGLYGASQNFRNSTHKSVIEYGYKNDRLNDAVHYTAKAYDTPGKVYYAEGAGRGATVGDEITVGRDAFINPNTKKFDATSLIQVLDHEGAHVGQGLLPVNPYPNNPGRSYIRSVGEAPAYQHNIQVGDAHGYSASMMNYVQRQFNQAVEGQWQYLMGY